MKNVLSSVRKGYMNVFSQLTYAGILIPVYEEMVPDMAPPVFIAFNNKQIQCYVVLINQTSTNVSPKCRRTDESSIQIQIVTVHQSGAGGSRLAELIADEVLIRVPAVASEFPLRIWKTEIVGQRNLNYETDNNRIWTTILTVNNWISQS